jgi:hypothetical protein
MPKVRGDCERFPFCAATGPFDLARPTTSAPDFCVTDISIRADSITQNGDIRHAANTAIPPRLALNLGH